MSTCVRCGKDVGFIGSLTFNKHTGRCGNCESETLQALNRFRTAFLNFCSDGVLTNEKWARLVAGAASEHLDMNEVLAFIRGDALNFLDRTLTFAVADGFITHEKERYILHLRAMLAIPDAAAQPLLNRLGYLKYLTSIRRGALPTVRTSIRLDSDEIGHLEIPASYHKHNTRSTTLVSGRFIATNKKLLFLSGSGGTEIKWSSFTRVDAYAGGIYLELSRKTGNGFYSVPDPLLVEAIIDTLVRIAKRQLVGPNPNGNANGRYIPHDVRVTVWQRDQGRCVGCGMSGLGASLEFDHIIPYSKGGASTVGNVQLLCRNCNLKKSDRI